MGSLLLTRVLQIVENVIYLKIVKKRMREYDGTKVQQAGDVGNANQVSEL